MVKLMACLRRKSGMSEKAFQQYWKDTHGPLVKSVTEFSRYVRKYIQSHTSQDSVSFFPPQATPAYDGIAELWFESTSEMQKAFAEPRYMEIIRADRPRTVLGIGCHPYGLLGDFTAQVSIYLRSSRRPPCRKLHA